jgi:hypothetical protein
MRAFEGFCRNRRLIF